MRSSIMGEQSRQETQGAMSNDNPSVSRFLRLFTLTELCILVIGGTALYFLGGLVRPIWAWDIPPFNLNFIGAIYLSSIPAIATLSLMGRWAPARIVLPMLMIFTGVAMIGTLLNAGALYPQRWTTWVWLVIYGALPINSAIHLWLYRRWPQALPAPTPAVWRYYLWGQAVVLILYGLGQFFAPVAFSGFWPWKVDAFHGQLYSGVFISLGTGAWLISRQAARIEVLVAALSQLGFGLWAIGGMLLIDSSVHRVNWPAPGLWVWIGACAVIAGAGLGLLAYGRGMKRTVAA
jgi:hypothetical protein